MLGIIQMLEVGTALIKLLLNSIDVYVLNKRLDVGAYALGFYSVVFLDGGVGWHKSRIVPLSLRTHNEFAFPGQTFENTHMLKRCLIE